MSAITNLSGGYIGLSDYGTMRPCGCVTSLLHVLAVSSTAMVLLAVPCTFLIWNQSDTKCLFYSCIFICVLSQAQPANATMKQEIGLLQTITAVHLVC